MLEKIKKWVVNHPYSLTTFVFLVIIYVGWRFLFWREENFAFILLLYFMVTLGIRLDDISRKIGTRSERPSDNPEDRETLMNQLNDIKDVLLTVNATLNRILDKTEKEE